MLERYMRNVGERSASALRRNRRPRRQARRRGFDPQAQIETLEQRRLLSVSILNGGGSGYVGNGGGGPPDVTGAAGPNSYLEVTNSTVTLFSPKANRTILAQRNINDFFFNAAAGNLTLIDQQFSGNLKPIATATEAGNTVTITTTGPHGFAAGQQVQVAGVGVAGYNGIFTINSVTATTFTYTDGASGLANSSGGTASNDPGSCGTCDSTGVFDNLMGASGRFIIGDIDIDGTTNVSQYIFAVSKTSNPTTFTPADWNFYTVTTTLGSGSSQTWTDYPGNPGFNADAFVETFNRAQGGGTTGDGEVVAINASDLASGVPQASLRFNVTDMPGTGSLRATAMHDSVTGDPMWLVRNPEDGSHVNIIRMDNVLSSSPTFTTTSLALPGALNFRASGINNPLNSDNSVMIDGDVDEDLDNPGNSPASDVDNRILNAGEYNNTVVAAQKVAVGTASVVAATVQVSNGTPVGGSGYTIGDTLTVNGGSGTSATLKVATLGAGGSVATVTVATAGSYTSLSGVNGTVSGGTGSGAKFNINFNGELDVQWYAIDVSGGTPAFQKVGGVDNIGRIGFGANTYSVEPSININSAGEIGMGFMESDTIGGAINPATGGFLSTFVTARKPTDAAGTMQPVVLVSAGTGTGTITGRIGDFSGLAVDPANGTFWHVNEFGGGGPTVIANFTPEDPPVVTAPSDQTADEGTSKAFDLGSFADADGSPWTVRVNWGDGSPDTVFTTSSSGPLGTRTHTYAEEGSKVVRVTVTDSTTLSDSKTFNVAVRDLAVTPAGTVIHPVEGQDTGSVTVATFTDPGGAEPVGDYSALIDWGDGSAPTVGAIALSAGTFSVWGNHTYAEESAADHPGSNPYAITITISHDAALDATANSTAVVSDPAVASIGGFTFTAVEGVPSATQTVAKFTDPGGPEPLGDYSASIDWGDGTALTPGTITLSAGVYTVTGSHTYAVGLGLPDDFGNTFCDGDPPSYHKPITVSITHEAAPLATAFSDAKISLAPASAHLAGGSLIVVGTAADDHIQFTPVGDSGAVAVSLNSYSLGSFTLGAGGRIIAAAMTGNDDIQVDSGVRLNTVLYGGPGNDRIKGGGGQNIECGCEGDDDLIGGSAHDLLIGGAGSDRLNGGHGGDILIAGINTDSLFNEDEKYSHLVAILNGGPVHALDDGVMDVLQGASGGNTLYYHFLGGGIGDRVDGHADTSINI